MSIRSPHAPLPALDLEVHTAGLPEEVSFSQVTYPSADGDHTCGYLSAGPVTGPLVLLLHGWPDLARSFAPLMVRLAAAGWRVVAPDMRGYGASSIYRDVAAYGVERAVADVRGLIDVLRAERTVEGARTAVPAAGEPTEVSDAEPFVVVIGHDYGAPVAWGFAAAHPQQCRAVAGICVPHLPPGTSMSEHINRAIYPAEEFPYGQWDYQVAHVQLPEVIAAEFDADVAGHVATLMRRGNPAQMTQPALMSVIRARGGWFPEGVPFREPDERVLSETDFAALVASLTRTGFTPPNSWYRNNEANAAFADEWPEGGRLDLPALFIHARYDQVCDTLGTTLAQPMRETVPQLTERIVESGHWVVQEKPIHTSEIILDWLESLDHDR